MTTKAIRGIPGEKDAVWIQFSADPSGWHYTTYGDPSAEEEAEIESALRAFDLQNGTEFVTRAGRPTTKKTVLMGLEASNDVHVATIEVEGDPEVIVLEGPSTRVFVRTGSDRGAAVFREMPHIRVKAPDATRAGLPEMLKAEFAVVRGEDGRAVGLDLAAFLDTEHLRIEGGLLVHAPRTLDRAEGDDEETAEGRRLSIGELLAARPETWR